MAVQQTKNYNMTEETRNGDFNRLLFTPVLVVGMTGNFFIVFKICKKHWNNLLPVHLHQISFFSDFFLLTSTGLITAWSVREGFTKKKLVEFSTEARFSTNKTKNGKNMGLKHWILPIDHCNTHLFFSTSPGNYNF